MSYDYINRQGVHDLTWHEFDMLCNQLVEELAPFQPDLVVGIARAGLFPATAIACKLRLDLWPVRVTRRERDHVVRKHPEWKVAVPDDVRAKKVAIVDEIADSGETLALVAAEVQARGAAALQTVAVAAHSWAKPFPNLVALTSDALLIFPWDKLVYQHGQWGKHPELKEALVLQERQ